LPVESVNDLRNKVGKLKQLIETAKTMRQNVQGLLTAAEAAVKGLPDLLKLKQEKEELDHAAKEVNQIIGAINLQIKQDDERIQQNAAKRKEIEGLKKATDRWERLNGFIGSADGKKFRSYAQAITLQQLIEIGNGHLASINPRYRMEYDAPETGAPERLEMIIIDQYQNDNRRTMATLSGGESFLISLALALGLSDLASGKQLIQSLFIDEGFGTLDGKTLDQAMTTLEQLQAQGKTIGLISHVPQLRERIYCQIELQRVGDGFSQVRIQG
jgi:exonuclease SbcC